jgi:hypothetical protein
MTRARRVDANQARIVAALRRVGCRVLHLHTVGAGCPDILVALGKRLVLMEIKDGSLPPSARRLTPAEQRFHDLWHGHVVVISSVDDALEWVRGGQTVAWRRNTQTKGGI